MPHKSISKKFLVSHIASFHRYKALGKQVLVPQMEIVKALLRLLAQGKSILLLDEPFAGIPQGCAAEIKEGFLRDDRVSMIWISHDEAEGPTGENMDCKLGNFML